MSFSKIEKMEVVDNYNKSEKEAARVRRSDRFTIRTSQVGGALEVKASAGIANINVNRNGRFNLVSMRVPFS